MVKIKHFLMVLYTVVQMKMSLVIINTVYTLFWPNFHPDTIDWILP